MRGTKAFDIAPPTGGVRFDLPDHLVTPDSLPGYLGPIQSELVTSGSSTFVVTMNGSGFTGVGSYNMMSDEDGSLRIRPNIGLITNTGVGERVMAIATSLGSVQPYFRSTWITTGHVINIFLGPVGLGTSISVPITQHTTPDTTVRPIVWMQSGSVFVLWVNQGMEYPVNPALGTNQSDGLSSFNLDSGAFAKVAGFPLTSATDITSLINRVVVVNQFGGGSNFSAAHVQWSAVNDFTNWPAGAGQELQDGGVDPIVAVRRTSQSSAILFRTNSAFMMYGVAGNDQTAFGFERIVACDGMMGPISPAAVVEAEGQYYYMGFDFRFYSFNGSTITEIGAPINHLVRSVIAPAFAHRSFAVYMQAQRLVCFAFVFNPPPGTGTPTGDPQVMVCFNLRTQTWESLWGFNFPITCAGQVFDVQPGFNNIGSRGLYGVWLGSKFGDIFRFDATGGGDTTGATGTVPISARYQSPLMRADNLHGLLGDSIQLYLKQGYTSEQVVIVVEGFQNPYDVAPKTQVSFTYDLANPTGFASKFPPGAGSANNIRGNWLRVSIYSNNLPGQLYFGGGTLWTNPDEMGDSPRTS